MAGKYLKTPQKLYDPNEAVALSKLVRSSIQRRLKELPNLRKEAYKEIFAKYPEAKRFTQGKLQQLLKQNNYDLYRVIKDLPSEQKALRRGLAEFLTTDPNFFDRKGLLDLFSKDLSKLEGKELMKTLKGWDNALSGYKDSTGKVGHHTTLSALTDLASSVDEKWRLDFNKLAELDGFNIGDEGLIKIAPGVHKPFDTVPGKNTRLVKGKLAETLSKFLPDAKFEKGRLHIVGGVNPKVDAILDQLAGISTHGEWAGGTVGFKVPPNLKDLSPSEAYKVARNTLGAEKAIAAHGIKLDKNLNNYLNKSNFNTLDELTDGLSSKFRQPNWQPPNIKDTLIKEVDVALNQATATKPLDVLDQPTTTRGLNTVVDEAVDTAEQLLEWRKIAKGGAIAGLGGLSILGTGASAAETTARVKIAKETGKPIDEIQAAISTFSLLNDAGSYTGAWAVPGAILSSAADATNIVIDEVRNPQTEEEKQRVQEKIDKTIEEQFGSTPSAASYGML